MNKKREGYYKGLFLTAAFYDFIIGITFLFFYKPVYRLLNIPFPLNPSYLSLSAAFVFVIGIGYYIIYRDIHANRGLVIVGAIYKFAYAAVGLYYLLINLVPHMIYIVFAVIDVIFLVLFIEFLNCTKKSSS